MPKVKDIPFRSIPHQSALFLSYLDLTPLALRFFQQTPTLNSIVNQLPARLADLQCPRLEIASILRRQNERYGCDQETLHRIDDLEKPDCVAILTGQQVGLFGGPLYTIYKALTAIQIAEELRRRDIPAVAIFWMEGEDHDLAEVTHCTMYDPHAGIYTADYRNTLFKDADMPPRSVGSIQFSGGVREVVRDYVGHLADSTWKPVIQSLLELTYRPGATFTQAFAQLLSSILRGSGLIFYDPQDIKAKRFTSTMFQRALRDTDAIHTALVQRNRDLEAAGFHSQVSIQENSTVLFFFVDGERRALERRDSGFGIRNSDRVFSLGEMLVFAEQTPERFSPNVLLRPLIQDHLFPTLAYIGGSSEVAYFSQIEVLYKLFGRPMPVIWPRNSFTLLEPEIASVTERLGIDVQDCFHGKQFMTEKAIRNSEFSKSVASMVKLHERLDQVFTEIRSEVQAVEPPLVQALETARRKILHNAQNLKSKIVRMEGAQNSSVLSAIDLLSDSCFPNRNLQERELSIHHFLSRHGPSLMDTLLSATDIGNFAHRVLQLEEGEPRGTT